LVAAAAAALAAASAGSAVPKRFFNRTCNSAHTRGEGGGGRAAKARHQQLARGQRRRCRWVGCRRGGGGGGGTHTPHKRRARGLFALIPRLLRAACRNQRQRAEPMVPAGSARPKAWHSTNCCQKHLDKQGAQEGSREAAGRCRFFGCVVLRKLFFANRRKPPQRGARNKN
jgi:hypothetical protein